VNGAAGFEPYSIHKSILVGAPAEAVWQGLGSQEGLRRWLAEEMAFEPRLGGRVLFHAYGCELAGRVTEFEPPRRLAFTWNQTPPGWPEPTLLTVTVADEGTGSRVHLVHSGFDRLPAKIRDEVFAGYVQGWEDDSDLIRLKQLAEGNDGAQGVIVGSHAVFGPDGPTALQIRMRVVIAAAPEKVWEAVSTPEGLNGWLSHDGRPLGESDNVEALLLPKLVVVNWGSEETPAQERSQLAIRLEAVRSGTRVLLYHQGFERLPTVAEQRFLDCRARWDGSELAALQRKLEGA
jgi:uncharacterized protein YndB with AHSA1/START domain